MQLFYNPDLGNSTSRFFFNPLESKHIVKVLRKKKGDQVHITNGRGYLYEAEIISEDQKKCRAQITKITKKHPKMYGLHLVVAPTKNNDRFEWFLEKATEIGVHEITPIFCERSERKIIKKKRLEKVILSAMKQSLRTYLPKLNEPIHFKDFVKLEHNGLLFIAHCEEEEKMDLKRRVAPDKDITILIGPEGDFSMEEIKESYKKGFLPVSLGEHRLRTETAALVACTIVNSVNTR